MTVSILADSDPPFTTVVKEDLRTSFKNISLVPGFCVQAGMTWQIFCNTSSLPIVF